MGQNDGWQIAGTQEDKRSVEAEDGSVAKLESGAGDGGCGGGVWVRKDELVAVVDVGDAKVQGCHEDELGERRLRHYVERDDERAED